jgi:hypothetical protein
MACFWYNFSFISPQFRTPRVESSSDIFSSLSKWRLFTEWSIYISHSFIEFSMNWAGFLWILRELVSFSLCNDSKTPKFEPSEFIQYLRNRKHFPCFYRVIETRVEVWEKREIAWKHSDFPNFHKCFYNSIGTRGKCFLFALLNGVLKTKKDKFIDLITFIEILILIYIPCKE